MLQEEPSQNTGKKLESRLHVREKSLCNYIQTILLTLTFCLLIILSFTFRIFEFEKTASKTGPEIPWPAYSIERYLQIENIVTGQALKKTTSTSPGLMEHIIAYTYKLRQFFINKKSSSVDLTFFIRLNLIFYVSLASGIIFLILISMKASYWLSFIGGALFAVSAAAVNGTFGLDISETGLSCSLILLIYFFFVKYREKENYLYLILLGISLYLSVLISQVCLINFLLFCLFIFLSPLFFKQPKSKYIKLIIALSVVSAFTALTFIYFYKDFFYEYFNKFYQLSVLFFNKIYFSNIQPQPPGKLSFINRLLWNIPYNSSSFSGYWNLFHFTFYFYLIIFFITFLYTELKNKFTSSLFFNSLLLFLISISFISYIYFQMLSVYVYSFICISLIILADNIHICLKKKFRITVPIFLTLLLIIEFLWSFNCTKQSTYQFQLDKYLVEWLTSTKAENNILLCDYSISPIINQYSKNQVVLNYSFTNSQNVDNIKKYYDIMYFGTEKELLEYCELNNTDYLVYSKNIIGGKFEDKYLHPYSKQYLGDCLELKPESPAYRMCHTPLEIKYFYKIDEPLPEPLNENFTVFKVITQSDIEKAKQLADEAQFFFDNHVFSRAKKLIQEAVSKVPNSANIRFLYYQIYNEWPFITLNEVKGQKLN